jgi:hypothetical protein
LVLGDQAELPGLTVVGDDSQVKPLLQACAKILGITARQMVDKVRPDQYEISPEFLLMLFTSPCDVFEGGKKIISAGDTVARHAIEGFVKIGTKLTIDSLQRLKLANAVTEQSARASEELANPNLSDEKKMNILSASLEMVAAQFQNSGMDEETVKLANASIQAVEKIANSATNVGKLVKQLLEAKGGYRYAHCQLITFLGFHVIKMMGWWGDDQREILSQAAFYHDISLTSDDEARVRTQAHLKTSGIQDPKKQEAVLTHPQLAARELQTVADISPEVVRVVVQHHGSPIGRGFSFDITRFDNLTKAFMLSEEWADYLIELSEKGAEPQNEKKRAELRDLYKDEVAHQIIETFKYLDPEEFKSDFLTTPESPATFLLRAGEDEAIPESTVAATGEPVKEGETVASAPAAFGATDLETLFQAATDKEIEDVKVSGGAAKEEEEVTVSGEGAAKDNAQKKISGVTEVRNDEEILVKGSPESFVDRSITRIKADKPKEQEKEIKIKALAGSTELMRAALGATLDTLNTLLAAENAAVELRKTDAEGRNAIHYAAMGGSVSVLQVLLDKGAAMNSVDTKRRSALFLAAMYKHNEAFDFLLAKGAKVNQQAMGGMTIAMIGAFSGNMHILKTAVQKGVRVDTRDHNGKTALDLAKQGQHAEAILFLDALMPKKGGKEKETAPAAPAAPSSSNR